MNLTHRTGRPFHGGEDHILHTGLNVIHSSRSDFAGRTGIEQVYQNAHIMRSQIPPGIHIRSQLAQIQTLGIDVKQVPQFPAVEDFLQSTYGRIKEKRMPGHDRQPLRRSIIQHLASLADTCREGFFHKDVFPGLQSRKRQGVMRERRSRDYHRLHIGIGKHLLRRGHRAHASESFFDKFPALGRGLRYHHDFRIGKLMEISEEIWTPVSTAKLGDF